VLPVGHGTLRVYLGMAPGVGKTYAMLSEGRRRRDRGADVAVALVETHARPPVDDLLDGLEIVPRRQLVYRATTFEEMDLDAVLARNPAVALVDELAHTNVPGALHEKRWKDVEDLLEAGIEVVSTVNISHLESLNTVVQRITGVQPRETVPDVVVRRAGHIEVVDVEPEALRQRIALGAVYPPERADVALSGYFRAGNLEALRALALDWAVGRGPGQDVRGPSTDAT
jgi:two-component system sensor histidine kinase KdpD